MAGNNPDLVVRVAANISALQADMAAASASVQATTASWQDFTKGFDLESTINHPLGTAKQAMSAFTAELGPAVVAAAEAAAGFAAVGVALFELADKAAAVGGKLNDLSEKTGLSVPALSRLSLAAQVAGTDVDTLASALFMLQRNIGEDSPKIEAGLNKIGLTLAELKSGGVDSYLTTIATHFKATEDPAARAAAAMELFNKQGREIIPTLMKLDEALAATADIQPWSAEQAHDAEAFEMQLTSLKVHVEALGTALGRDLIPYVSGFIGVVVPAGVELASLMGRFTGITPALHDLAEAWRYAAAAVDLYRGTAATLPPVTGPATLGVTALHAALKDWMTVPVIDVMAKQAAAIRDATAEMEAQKRAAAELAKAQQLEVAQAAELTKVTDQYYKAVNALSHDTTAVRINDAYLTADAEIAAMQRSKTYTIAAEMEIWATADKVAQGIIQKTLESDQYSKEHYQKLRDEAYNAYEFALDTASSHTNQEIQMLAAKYREAEQASMHWGDAANADMDRVSVGAHKVVVDLDKIKAAADAAAAAANRAMGGSSAVNALNFADTVGSYITGMSGGVAGLAITHGLDQTAALKYAQRGYSFEEIVFLLTKWQGQQGQEPAPAGPKIPGFRYGSDGVQDFGSGTLAMLHGREAIVPAGSGSRGGDTIQIYITQPLGTTDAIAKAVDEALMARQRNTGQRF